MALWLWLVSFLPWLERLSLFLASALLLILSLFLARARLARALPRLRWLVLAIVAVFGWTTPGRYFWSGWLSPTHEGLWLGCEQTLRLLGVVASLQVLLTFTHRDALFAGLYSLARPFDWIGVSRERVAVRLALTIEMTESLLEKKMHFRHLLDELERADEVAADRSVALALIRWTPFQRLLLLVCLFLIGFSFWLGRHGAWL